MPLTLRVDAARWHGHVDRYLAEAAAAGVTVVPVTKGNGYGFGNQVLATTAAALDVATLAVGTYEEIAAVSDAFIGNLLVLSPWRPWNDTVADVSRTVHTVSRLDDLGLLADRYTRPRVVVELLTSMRRHGIERDDLPELVKHLDSVSFEGFALHLPLCGDQAAEAVALADDAFSAVDGANRTLWVSHVTPDEAAEIGRRTGTEARLRVATTLWLGERDALRATATVLDVHRLGRRQTYGYRQRRTWRGGSLIVVSGGTAHGIAMEAPTPATTIRQRALALARGGLESAGRALSPFRVSGKQCWFAEPPHMQSSMVWLPADAEPPAVGDEVDVTVRLTTTTFDDIVWSGLSQPSDR